SISNRCRKANRLRLRGMEYPTDTVQRPRYFGLLTNDIVYDRLAPVGQWLRKPASTASFIRPRGQIRTLPRLPAALIRQLGPGLRAVSCCNDTHDTVQHEIHNGSLSGPCQSPAHEAKLRHYRGCQRP